MKYTFLIVDDERLSRDYIHDLIVEFEPEATVHSASSAKMALSMIGEVKPDILFLDIKMPGSDGFAFLESTDYRDFELVFITAYSEHAIKAFKEGACDYLLKPIKKSDFKETLRRAVTRRKNELDRRQYAPENQPDSHLGHRLVISHQTGIKTLVLRDIVYLEADNSYTTLYMSGGEKIVTSKPIHYFEKTLSPEWFFRIHKSNMINLHHFKEYNSVNKMAMMSNGVKLMISRYRLREFLQFVKTLQDKKQAPS